MATVCRLTSAAEVALQQLFKESTRDKKRILELEGAY